MVEGAEPFEWRTGALCFKPKNPVLKTHSIAGEARDHLEPGDCLLELRKSEKKKRSEQSKGSDGGNGCTCSTFNIERHFALRDGELRPLHSCSSVQTQEERPFGSGGKTGVNGTRRREGAQRFGTSRAPLKIQQRRCSEWARRRRGVELGSRLLPTESQPSDDHGTCCWCGGLLHSKLGSHL